jgi:hypothetical protein
VVADIRRLRLHHVTRSRCDTSTHKTLSVRWNGTAWKTGTQPESGGTEQPARRLGRHLGRAGIVRWNGTTWK